MESKIILVNTIDDVDFLKKEERQFSEYKIFSFDII